LNVCIRPEWIFKEFVISRGEAVNFSSYR